MTDIAIVSSPFQPKPSRSETKAEATDAAARAILDDEAARREAKTARLRAARLAAVKAAAVKAASVAAPAKKTARTRRSA